MARCFAWPGLAVGSAVYSSQPKQQPLSWAIDGCAFDCAKKSLEEAGFTRINHLRLTDLGFEKGNTDVSSDSIAMLVDKAKTFLSE